MKLLRNISIFAITTTYTASHAHVQLLSPPSIINSDYQYTFEQGICAQDTCDSFCGQSDLNPTITSIQPTNDGYINAKLLINVRHNPYRYRISVHDGDIKTIQGFDTNILLDDIEMDEAQDGGVSVPIPKDLKCDPYCVLQLFDYYYFVSCSLFTLDGSTEEETTLIPDENISEIDTTLPDTKPIISQEEIVFQNIPAVRISMMMSLDYMTYLALGISTNGFMVRSSAIIGSVDENQDDNHELLAETGIYATKEYVLGGKFPELVTPTVEDEKLALISNFTIDHMESGLYKHTLEVILRKDTSICGKTSTGTGGKKIIWSYSSHMSPSTVLAIHGIETRGLHPLPIMCEKEFELESSVGRDNDESGTSTLDSSNGNSRRSKYSVVLIPTLFIRLFV